MKKEIIAAHNYINIVGNKIGQVRYLGEKDINDLLSLESEKHRQSM
jgi:hypothetical protein